MSKYAVVYSEEAKRVILGWDQPSDTYDTLEAAMARASKDNRKLRARYPNALSGYSVYERDDDGDWIPADESEVA